MLEALEVADDLHRTEFGLAIKPVNKGNGDLCYFHTRRLGADDHFHLEDVALGDAAGDERLKHLFLVQTERTSQVGRARPQDRGGNKICNTAIRYA